jgi:DNA-directed RNA polymerase subunit RPC12/RpoP
MQYRCVACGIESPESDTLLMLIGEHGWRPLWEHGTIAHPAMEWRCPACWAEFKEASTQGLPSSRTMIAQAAALDAKPTLPDDATPEGDRPPRKPG